MLTVIWSRVSFKDLINFDLLFENNIILKEQFSKKKFLEGTLIFLRHASPESNFNRSLSEYSTGFTNGEDFWLGKFSKIFRDTMF